MPFCANCDEWFEGQKSDKAACEHCDQINPLEIIANQDDNPETWVCRNYFEIKGDLFPFKAAMLLPAVGALVAKTYFNLHTLGYFLIGLAIGLTLLAWRLNRVLLVASQDGETQMFRVISCYGIVVSQKERTPEKTGPVIIQLVNSFDPQTNEPIERRLILLDRFTVTGFSSRDGGLRFARILADHCGLQMQRLFGA